MVQTDRSRLERDRDLGQAPGEALAGAQVKGHPRPAPGLHEGFEADEGRGDRLGIDARLFVIAGHLVPVDGPGLVLAEHHVLGLDGGHRSEHLDLLVADGIGPEVDRRLHRHQREELDEVVLDHVAQRSGLLVVAGPALDSQ